MVVRNTCNSIKTPKMFNGGILVSVNNYFVYIIYSHNILYIVFLCKVFTSRIAIQ